MDNIKPLATAMIAVVLFLITWCAWYAAAYIASLLSGVDYFKILVALAAVATAVLAALVWYNASNRRSLMWVKLLDPFSTRRGQPFVVENLVRAKPAYYEGEYYVYDAIGYYILSRDGIILAWSRDIPKDLVKQLARGEEPEGPDKWEYRRALKAYRKGTHIRFRTIVAFSSAASSLADLEKAFEGFAASSADLKKAFDGFGEIVRRASERHH